MFFPKVGFSTWLAVTVLLAPVSGWARDHNGHSGGSPRASGGRSGGSQGRVAPGFSGGNRNYSGQTFSGQRSASNYRAPAYRNPSGPRGSGYSRGYYPSRTYSAPRYYGRPSVRYYGSRPYGSGL